MIRLLILCLAVAVSACGMKSFDPVSHDLPDGSTLEVRGQWAETFSQGYVGQETYRCDEGYNVVKASKVDGVVNYEVMCEQISSYHNADRGIVRGMAEGAVPSAIGGWFYMKGQEKRRPDQTNVSNVNEGGNATGGEAYAEGGQGGHGGAGGAGGAGGSVSVVTDVSTSLNNAISNQQQQGQIQGQHQGQSSHNNNTNVNVNKPTANASASSSASAQAKPKIINKPTFNNTNNNKPVNVNVNKPTFNNSSTGGACSGTNNCNANGNGQGGYNNHNKKH